jgi:hypothetical protein
MRGGFLSNLGEREEEGKLAPNRLALNRGRE